MKIRACLIILISTLLTAGCTSSNDEETKENNQVLEKQNKDLQAKVVQLEEEVSRLKNSSENLFTKAVEESDKGNYKSALEILDSIISKYPTSESAKSAGKKKKEISAKLAEQEKAKQAAFDELIKQAKTQKNPDDSIKVLQEGRSVIDSKFNEAIDSLIKEYTESKNKPPLQVLKAWVTFNVIDKPEARIRVKNLSAKTIDAYEATVLTFDNYNFPSEEL